jgi:hypothetical protein
MDGAVLERRINPFGTFTSLLFIHTLSWRIYERLSGRKVEPSQQKVSSTGSRQVAGNQLRHLTRSRAPSS